MTKVITLEDFLRMKREAGIKAEAKVVAKQEKKEKLFNGISYMAGIILYWIACMILVAGFYTVVLLSL